MPLRFAGPDPDAVPLHLIAPDAVETLKNSLPAHQTAWLGAHDFRASHGQALALPGPDGQIEAAVVGLGSDSERQRHRFALGAARPRLPAATYKLETALGTEEASNEYLGWLLAGYSFTRYKDAPPPKAELLGPQDAANSERIQHIAAGEALTRDLINTPAEDMGPDELEAGARKLAQDHGAEISVIVGEDLLTQNFPLIHTVGRAAPRAPRLIDLRWGSEGPALTLVGKGVCFDTGGLNLKPGGSMGLMKKDMGGAATTLGLARMIMALRLQVRLRLLIPAVENAVAGNAFRPGDILTARAGQTVEINNTDAEGRLVLADALALADEEKPDLIVSMATLTGAARVAVGPDLAPYYTDIASHATALDAAAAKVADPVWRMPFHTPYDAMIEPGIADLDNAPKGGFAGSITAALFLRRFVSAAPYMHFDIYGWQPSAAPARPKGGVGQGARALLEAIPQMLGTS